MANCSNCGKYMDGWGSVCGVCKDNAKIQEGQADMQRQLQESAREAAWAAERHLDEVRAAKWQASANHEEAMRAESDRLEELQKQTQILLEGQITNEEAYQRGFDLEDEYLNLLLTEDGRVYWEIYEPYLVARLNAAYEKGAQDRLEKEFESSYPGLEYMKQEAYGHGYAGSRNCSIVYLHHIPHLYPAKLDILSETGLKQTTNQETGTLEWQWMPAYMSEALNDAYDAGAQQFLNEQNTAELVAERLEKFRVEKTLVEKQANKWILESLDKEKKDRVKRKKRVILIVSAMIICLVFAFVYKKYFDHSDSYRLFRNTLLSSGWKVLPLRDKRIGKGEVQYCSEDLLCFVEFIDPKNKRMVKIVTYRVCASAINNCYEDHRPDGYEKIVAIEDISRIAADMNFKNIAH